MLEFGKQGIVYISGTDAFVADYANARVGNPTADGAGFQYIQTASSFPGFLVLADAVLASGTVAPTVQKLAQLITDAVVLPAGTYIPGVFTTIKLVSGSVLALQERR